MTKISTPQAEDWNHYWSLDQTQKFTKISWSKKRIIKVLNTYLKESSTALDAGCGSGFFSQYFCSRGIETVSLDYSDDALKIASKLTEGKATLLKMNLVEECLADKTDKRFDIIFTDGLMEHFSIDHQNKIVQNLYSVLRDDGVLVTFVPNRWSPWELIRPFYMPGIEEDPFVMKGLVDLNVRNGLNVLEKGGVNTIPFRLSPDKSLGSLFGMLLYTVAKK